MEFIDTGRDFNLAVKELLTDIKEQLNDQNDIYIPGDDDIDSLADTSGDTFKILPYPGPTDFGNWVESQFSSVIPKGTAAFLDQFNITTEEDTYYWSSLYSHDYLELLGPEQYDKVRNTLAELHLI